MIVLLSNAKLLSDLRCTCGYNTSTPSYNSIKVLQLAYSKL